MDEEFLVTHSGKGQILTVFSCTAGGRTLDSSPLSNCIEDLTRAQVRGSKGVFNSLDGRKLRYYLNETETLDLTQSKLNWRVPMVGYDKTRLSGKALDSGWFNWATPVKFPSDKLLS